MIEWLLLLKVTCFNSLYLIEWNRLVSCLLFEGHLFQQPFDCVRQVVQLLLVWRSLVSIAFNWLSDCFFWQSLFLTAFTWLNETCWSVASCLKVTSDCVKRVVWLSLNWMPLVSTDFWLSEEDWWIASCLKFSCFNSLLIEWRRLMNCLLFEVLLFQQCFDWVKKIDKLPLVWSSLVSTVFWLSGEDWWIASCLKFSCFNSLLIEWRRLMNCLLFEVLLFQQPFDWVRQVVQLLLVWKSLVSTAFCLSEASCSIASCLKVTCFISLLIEWGKLFNCFLFESHLFQQPFDWVRQVVQLILVWRSRVATAFWLSEASCSIASCLKVTCFTSLLIEWG